MLSICSVYAIYFTFQKCYNVSNPRKAAWVMRCNTKMRNKQKRFARNSEPLYFIKKGWRKYK